MLLATVAAVAAMWMALGGCDDDSPNPATPGTGSQVGGGGSDVDDLTGGGGGADTVLPRDTSPGATDAPNPNAGGGGAGTGTSPP
jgi:hypothetical protein